MFVLNYLGAFLITVPVTFLIHDKIFLFVSLVNRAAGRLQLIPSEVRKCCSNTSTSLAVPLKDLKIII